MVLFTNASAYITYFGGLKSASINSYVRDKTSLSDRIPSCCHDAVSYIKLADILKYLKNLDNPGGTDFLWV